MRGCDYGSLNIECDDSQDCGPGQEHAFGGGEFGYALCAEPGDQDRGVACSDASDGSADFPVCGELDDFGYFGPFAESLGWLPRACSPGSSAE